MKPQRIDLRQAGPHILPAEDWPVFWAAVFLALAAYAAAGAGEHGPWYWAAAGIAGGAFVEILRAHVHS